MSVGVCDGGPGDTGLQRGPTLSTLLWQNEEEKSSLICEFELRLTNEGSMLFNSYHRTVITLK